MIRALPEQASPGETEPSGFSPRVHDELLHLGRMLADPTRVKILLYLTEATELNVTALCRRLGQSQPAVSHHLAVLRDGGLLGVRRAGKNNFYFLSNPDFQLLIHQFCVKDAESAESRVEEYSLANR